VARRRQRKAKESTARSAPEAQADLWSQAPAPADTTAPAPVQGEEVPVRAAAQVQVESAEGVVLTPRTTPVPDLPVPLEPVAAPAPPPLATTRKAEAIERCDALGQVPTTRELRLEFRGLRIEDRRWVQQQLRIVGKLIPQALSLAAQLAEGPERRRGGWSL
jgi:hypothetical protein